jgi:hypothetical protein
MMVAAHRYDLNGATACGWSTAPIQRPTEPTGDGHTAPELNRSTLEELAAVLLSSGQDRYTDTQEPLALQTSVLARAGRLGNAKGEGWCSRAGARDIRRQDEPAIKAVPTCGASS